MTHEDERRILESFPEAKIIKVKQDCVIGEHYHKIRTEQFVLVEGSCKLVISSVGGLKMKGIQKMKKGTLYIVPPNTYHEFHIAKDSVLIGINSHPYDATDDYKL